MESNTSRLREEEFAKTDRNQVRRSPNRAQYDKQAVYGVLDSTPLCHVSFVQDGKPCTIPMMFGRQDDDLLFHGATTSRLMQVLSSGQELCISATLLDGLVVAKSLFHSSMNYRSVTVFGRGRAILDEEQRMDGLKQMSDKVMPGRWEDARYPTPQELKATLVAAVKVDNASAKIRTGDPCDTDEDLALPFWSGVVPFRATAGSPIPDAHSASEKRPVPEYVNDWVRAMNRTTVTQD